MVVGPLAGRATAVEFYPVLAKEFSPPHHRTSTTYKTAVGEVTFDRAAKLETGGTDAAASIKADGSGYVVEFRAPRHAPLEFAPGFRFRLDASVILADPDGTASRLRLPWHSRKPEDMMTQDSYTEAMLRPQNWGEAVLE